MIIFLFHNRSPIPLKCGTDTLNVRAVQRFLYQCLKIKFLFFNQHLGKLGACAPVNHSSLSVNLTIAEENTMSSIKAIIFDKDGTLHDTEKVYMQAWKAAAEEFNVPDIENTVRDCTGTTIPWIAEYWAKKYPHIPFEDYLPRRQFYYFGILEKGVPVKEGAHEVLTYLKAHGYKVGMATSTPWDTVKDHLDEELYEEALRYLKASGGYSMNAPYM